MKSVMNRAVLVLTLGIICMILNQRTAAYKTEIEITPEPTLETTTKKSGGFFSGFKKIFGGSSATTVSPGAIEVTTVKNPRQNLPPLNIPGATPTRPTPPPLIIPQAPLVPLGPRPDTPSSSPLGGNQQQPPQWPVANTPGASNTPQQPQSPQKPQLATNTNTGGFNVPQSAANAPSVPGFKNPSSGSSAGSVIPQQPQSPQKPQSNTNIGAGGFNVPSNNPSNVFPGSQPNFPPGAMPVRPTRRPQPSPFDLSYGGGSNSGGFGGRPQSSGSGLAPLTSSTSTTTASPALKQPTIDFDLRGGGAAGSLIPTSSTARPQKPKEDFPALPAPRRPSSGDKEDFPALPSPKTPPSSPAAPNRPASPTSWGSPTPAWGLPTSSTPSSIIKDGLRSSTPAGNRVAFVPHVAGSTTTQKPGAQQSASALASDDEIRAFTENLYGKETNSQLSSIRVNPQGKTRSIDSADEAPKPLLEVDPKALEPNTIAKMRLLFNNYEKDTLTNEYVTPNERKEENDFVDAVLATSVMRQAMLFLQEKGIVTPDPKTHRDLLKELWFTQYSRGSGKIGSSGFEHVFVNEVKNGTIIGLHNWVYFYEEEQAGRLDYKGYLNQLDVGSKGKIVKARFTHNGLNKPVNTLFIGTSPELELALYTVCFQLRPDSTCPVSLGNSKFGIVTYTWRYRGKKLIGSAFPEI